MFIVLLLLLANITVRSSDEREKIKPKPFTGQKIEIQFNDSGNPTKEYPLEYIKYFPTINNIIEDIGVAELIGGNIPVPIDVNKDTFNCLIHYVAELYEKDERLPDARETFQTIKQRCPNVLPADLLIGTNYLDIKTPVVDKASGTIMSFKSLIAFLYADSIKTRSFTIFEDNQKEPIFDNLPNELEPLIRDWILQDLLKEFITNKFDNLTEKSKPLVSRDSSYKFHHSLCLSATKNGFGYVWRNEPYHRNNSNGLYIDFAKNELVDMHIPLASFDTNRCSLSEDGAYLLVTNVLVLNTETEFILYNIKNKKIEKRIKIPIDHEIVKSVLFNAKKNVFNIITVDGLENDDTKTLFTAYQLDLDKNNNVVEESSFTINGIESFWFNTFRLSCVHGNLVGFDCETDKLPVLLFDTDQKKLRICREKEDGNLVFDDGNGKEYITDITIINSKLEESFLEKGVFETSTIPFFKEIIANIVKNKIKKLPSYSGNDLADFLRDPQAAIDFNHFHLHFVDKSNNTLNISYFFDPKLIESLQVLRNAEGGLADAYFLLQYYMNPTKWHIKCKNIINPTNMFIKPAIQKIYGLDQLTTNPLNQMNQSPAGFWDAYKQGKLRSYTQQRWQSFYNRYKRPILGGAAVVGSTTFASWWLSKSKQLPASASNNR